MDFASGAGDAQDKIRSISDGRFKVIWNQEPHRPWMQLSSYKRGEYPAFTLYRVLHARNELPSPYDQFMASSRPEFEFYDLKKDPMELHKLSVKSRHKSKFLYLKETLISKLEEYEGTKELEPAEKTQEARQASAQYFKKKMERAGLPEEISDEELLRYWYRLLLRR